MHAIAEIRKVDCKGRICIPANFLESLGVGVKNELALFRCNNNLILKNAATLLNSGKAIGKTTTLDYQNRVVLSPEIRTAFGLIEYVEIFRINDGIVICNHTPEEQP